MTTHVGQSLRLQWCTGACWYWSCSCGAQGLLHYGPERLEGLWRRHVGSLPAAWQEEHWDHYSLEGETSVERLKGLTKELDILIQARAIVRSAGPAAQRLMQLDELLS